MDEQEEGNIPSVIFFVLKKIIQGVIDQLDGIADSQIEIDEKLQVDTYG